MALNVKGLDSYKMPSKKSDPMLDDSDLGMEDPEMAEAPSALADVSDEELMLEMEKRGFKVEQPEVEMEEAEDMDDLA